MNSAWAQANGMAEPEGSPGVSRRAGIGAASQTCSGIMPAGPVIATMASR